MTGLPCSTLFVPIFLFHFLYSDQKCCANGKYSKYLITADHMTDLKNIFKQGRKKRILEFTQSREVTSATRHHIIMTSAPRASFFKIRQLSRSIQNSIKPEVTRLKPCPDRSNRSRVPFSPKLLLQA